MHIHAFQKIHARGHACHLYLWREWEPLLRGKSALSGSQGQETTQAVAILMMWNHDIDRLKLPIVQFSMCAIWDIELYSHFQVATGYAKLYLCSLPRKHLVSMQNQLVGCERNILSIGFRKLELCLFLFEFVGRFSASSFSEEPLRYPHHLRWSALCCVCVRGFKVQLSTAPLHTAGRNHAYKWQTSDIPSLPHSLMIYTYIHTQIHIISIIHQHTFTLGIYIYCLFSGCLHSPVCDPSTYILSLSSPQKQAKPVGG